MHSLLTSACAQADDCIAAALARTPRARTAPSPRGTLASAAPRSCGTDAEALAQRLALAGTWLEEVQAVNGFLNFTLSTQWYEAVIRQPLSAPPMEELTPLEHPFPASIHPFDWAFFCALRGKKPQPELMARQDQSNPGWLLRVTLRRLERTEERCACSTAWTAEARALLLLLARYEESAGAKRQALYLTQVCQELWSFGPLRLSAPLNRFAQGVLRSGCQSIR